MVTNAKKVTITLIRSLNKKLVSHKDCARSLGLRKIGDTRSFEQATPAIMGMINKISYLLKVEGLE